MKEVFHPGNSRLEGIILGNLDLLDPKDIPNLLDQKDIPNAFINALAHISVYDAVLKKWESGDYSQQTSVINFPAAALMTVVRPTFKRLLLEQEKLIDYTQRR